MPPGELVARVRDLPLATLLAKCGGGLPPGEP